MTNLIRIKKPKHDNFTIMCNYHLKDENLSLKAKGLLSIIFSLPDDWKFSMKGLTSICKENERTIKTILKELQDNDYLKITKSHQDSGQFCYFYTFYEIPENKQPDTQKPHVVKPEVVKPEVVNYTQLSTKESSTKELSTKENKKIKVTTTKDTRTNENNLFSFAENVFGRTLSGIEYEIISTWEDNELTRYAINQAGLARAFNIRYVERILQSYKQENIKTVTEAEERDRRWREKKGKRQTEPKKTFLERLEEDKRRLMNDGN